MRRRSPFNNTASPAERSQFRPHGPAEQFAAELIRVDNVGLVLAARPILDQINLSVRRGEFLCVVGPSGCGKTSLLRVIAGLFHATQGEVLFEGTRVVDPCPEISIVFQDYGKALLPWRTAAGNISLALEAKKIPRRHRETRISELLAMAGLAEHHDKFPSQLSGGMQQRLQIARCLAQDPVVLLMDEPFGALDALTRQALQDEVLSIAASNQVTVIFVTHDLEEAIYLGDRVIGLTSNPGRIGATFQVDLPRPRDQLSTREHPEFLRLRRELFDFIKHVEVAVST
jgi:NitT/TauT family transport system ATP-binding protein